MTTTDVDCDSYTSTLNVDQTNNISTLYPVHAHDELNSCNACSNVLKIDACSPDLNASKSYYETVVNKIDSCSKSNGESMNVGFIGDTSEYLTINELKSRTSQQLLEKLKQLQTACISIKNELKIREEY